MKLRRRRRVRVDPRQICPLCRDSLATLAKTEKLGICPRCRTLVHDACADEMGGCATMGCIPPPRTEAPRPLSEQRFYEPDFRDETPLRELQPEGASGWLLQFVLFACISAGMWATAIYGQYPLFAVLACMVGLAAVVSGIVAVSELIALGSSLRRRG